MIMLFHSVLYMSLAGSYVFFIVLLARLLLSKCPKKYTYFLWLLVFLRFACPVFPEGTFSLLPASDVRIKAEIGVNRALSQGNAFGTEDAARHQWQGSASYMQGEEKGEEVFSPAGDSSESSYTEDAVEKQSPNPLWNFKSFLWDLWIWLPFLWALGAAAFLLYHAFSYVRLKRRLLGAAEVEPGVYEIDRKSVV